MERLKCRPRKLCRYGAGKMSVLGALCLLYHSLFRLAL